MPNKKQSTVQLSSKSEGILKYNGKNNKNKDTRPKVHGRMIIINFRILNNRQSNEWLKCSHQNKNGEDIKLTGFLICTICLLL